MKTNRYLLAGFVVSLALNLLAVGFFTGRAMNHEVDLRRVDPMLGMRRLLGGLTEERIEVLRPYYREYFASLRPRFREIRSAQGSLRDAMLTEPLDTAALKSALVTFNAHLFETQGNSHDAFVALANALTVAERQQLVGYLAEPPMRGDRPRHRGERPPRPGDPSWPGTRRDEPITPGAAGRPAPP